MIEVVGIVLTVQGIGGFIHRLAGSDNASWFVQLHLLSPSLHIPISVAMAVIGLAMVSGRAVRKRGEQ